MAQEKALDRPRTKAWRETLGEEAQEGTQVAVEEVDNPHLPKDHPWYHYKSCNLKAMSGWWEDSQNPSLATARKQTTS